MTKRSSLKELPHMLYADNQGRIHDHPHLRMTGFQGLDPGPVSPGSLVEVPAFSKLFYMPGCPPVGLDPATGRCEVLEEGPVVGGIEPVNAVAAFLEPGIVRTLLPAADYKAKEYVLPSWAYTAVGFKRGRYWAAGFRVEENPRWDPRNYDDRELVPAIRAYRAAHGSDRLVEHLVRCATVNHCFAAKNLFLGRWEAPLPVSRACNAACLGCLSLQPEDGCPASHQRIGFTPSTEEVVSLAVGHLERAPRSIVSFGQGCEGEPLTEHELIARSVREIRSKTGRGTVNMNTNGSMPGALEEILESGLDSVRISLNSARPEVYEAYYRPTGYGFEDVVESLARARSRGVYTMINYLVFPGISDREAELEALMDLVARTGVQFIHLKNL
ncbi:MAG: radical SAM protein, partial [Desulfobacteraceae bacterium]